MWPALHAASSFVLRFPHLLDFFVVAMRCSPDFTSLHCIFKNLQHRDMTVSSITTIDSAFGDYFHTIETKIPDDSLGNRRQLLRKQPLFDMPASWWTQVADLDVLYKFELICACFTPTPPTSACSLGPSLPITLKIHLTHDFSFSLDIVITPHRRPGLTQFLSYQGCWPWRCWYGNGSGICCGTVQIYHPTLFSPL